MAVSPPTRVLIVDFGAIARQGFRQTLSDRGFEVVAGDCPVDEAEERIRRNRPDVVVVDLDGGATDAMVDLITAEFPATRVVACSAEQPRMRVFPAGGRAYTEALDPDTLSRAVRG